MKTKFTSKFITLILSVVMIATLCVGFSVTAFAAETDYTAPAAGEAKIYGANVNLGGDIAMKYHVEIGSDIDINKLVLKVEFLGMVKELSYSATEGNYYIFELDGITPQCMGDTINAQLVYDGTALTCADASKNDYSVKDNLVNLYNSADTDEKTKRLIVDTLEYGAAAQNYRDYKTDALVTTGFDAASSDTDVAVPVNNPVLDDQSASVSVSANVRYSTVNYLLFGLTGADSFDGKVTIDGSAVTGEMKDGYYAVATGAVSPEDFAKDFAMKYDNGETDFINLTYSVNDYCYAAYTNGATQNMKDLALALYNYGLSAHLYLGEHTGGEATCQGQQCEVCGTYYGEIDSNTHIFNSADGKCSDCQTFVAEASVTIGENTTYYETLAEAATVAQTGTEAAPAILKLEQDIDLGSECLQTFSGVFTLDLNGKTLSSRKNNWGALCINGGSVTITDTGEGGAITHSTFYGVMAWKGCTVTIEGGTIIGYYVGVDCMESTVIINGGTIIGENEFGVQVGNSTEDVTNCKVTINGGTITGSEHDLYNYNSTIILGLGEDGVGATFPVGLNMVDSDGYGDQKPGGFTLKDILGEGAAYWLGDKMVFLTEGQTSIDGDVTVKKECKHENATYPEITDTQHKLVCSCGYEVIEDHSITAEDDKVATCQNKAYCSVCKSEYGDTLTHNYTYTADDETDTITESCDKGCGHNATITITAPSNAVYNGGEQGVTVTGDLVAEHTLTYNVEGTPVNAGDYTATLTVGDKSVSVEFTITKADPEFTVPTGLTATYGNTLAEVELPAGWTWKDAETTFVGNAGTNTFKALYNPGSNNYNTVEADVTIEVAKAEIDDLTLISPEFAKDLVYNGTAQALVTKNGSIEGGTIVYSLSPDGEYTETIPVATEVGKYVVYWMVKGDENHNDAGDPGAAYTTVYIIAMAVAEVDVTVGNLEASYAYTGEVIEPEITVTVGGKELAQGTDYEISYGENTNAGSTGTITITFKGNYSGTVVLEFAIAVIEGTDDFISDWMPVG